MQSGVHIFGHIWVRLNVTQLSAHSHAFSWSQRTQPSLISALLPFAAAHPPFTDMEQFIRALNGDKITLDNVLPDDLNFKDLDWIIIILRNLSDQALEATGRIVQMMIEELDEVDIHLNGNRELCSPSS